MPGSFKAEAVVLRSIRFGEADRVLHLYTAERGRVGAIAKGVRKVKSRLGGRLEPLSRVQLVLHEGRGELCTISQADTVHAHPALREHRASLERASQACEAVLRLLDSHEANPPAYNLLCHELHLLDAQPKSATALAGARVPGQAAARGRLRSRAGLVRLLRRDRAPGRLLAQRRRRGVRELRGRLVPARRRSRTTSWSPRWASRWPRRPRRATWRWPRPTARSRRPLEFHAHVRLSRVM